MNCAYYYELGTKFELDEIHEFLSELPSAHCSVIKLYAIGTPIEEISSKTGKSRSQVIKELGLYKGILN